MEPTVLHGYRDSASLRQSFNRLAGVVFGLDFEPWYQNGFWGDAYDPYSLVVEGQVVSKQELFEKVWEDKFTGDGTLNVHIRKIREAIEPEPGNPQYILTVWGEGYRFAKH